MKKTGPMIGYGMPKARMCRSILVLTVEMRDAGVLIGAGQRGIEEVLHARGFADGSHLS